jgi:hypothetical protein
MIICPNCNHREFVGALFCSECAAKLISTGRLSSAVSEQVVQEEIRNSIYRNRRLNYVGTGSLMSNKKLYLHVMDSDQFYPVKSNSRIVLGRKADSQTQMPDIDLSPFHAYAYGVSRLHAEIRYDDHGMVVIDLSSSNGTRINGQMITPHVEYPLTIGDIITLGKFRIQIVQK